PGLREYAPAPATHVIVDRNNLKIKPPCPTYPPVRLRSLSSEPSPLHPVRRGDGLRESRRTGRRYDTICFWEFEGPGPSRLDRKTAVRRSASPGHHLPTSPPAPRADRVLSEARRG